MMSIVIKSQKFPDSEIKGPEMPEFLQDISKYSEGRLAELRRVAFWFSQLQRFTRSENQYLTGHIDWLLKQRAKNV